MMMIDSEENTGLSHLGASTREVILSMEARTDSNQKLYTALAENLRQYVWRRRDGLIGDWDWTLLVVDVS